MYSLVLWSRDFLYCSRNVLDFTFYSGNIFEPGVGGISKAGGVCQSKTGSATLVPVQRAQNPHHLQHPLGCHPGEEQPPLVEAIHRLLQLPGAQLHNTQEVKPRPVSHLQPFSWSSCRGRGWVGHQISPEDGFLNIRVNYTVNMYINLQKEKQQGTFTTNCTVYSAIYDTYTNYTNTSIFLVFLLNLSRTKYVQNDSLDMVDKKIFFFIVKVGFLKQYSEISDFHMISGQEANCAHLGNRYRYLLVYQLRRRYSPSSLLAGDGADPGQGAWAGGRAAAGSREVSGAPAAQTALGGCTPRQGR